MLSRRLCLLKKARCFSTEVNVITSKAKRVEIPKINFHEYVWRNLDKWPDRTATICFETNRSYTYHQLYKRSLSLTRFFKENLKLKPLDTVGVVLPNFPEFPIVILGSMQAGLKVTTCNPNYTADEIRKQFQDSNPRIVFTSRDLLPLVRTATLDKSIPIVEITNEDGFSEGAISFKEISSREGCKEATVDINETALLPYSSGTTGLPKGVQLSHFNLVANLTQLDSPEFNFVHSDENEILPAFLPFFHIYGLIVVLFHGMCQGAKLIAMPKFSTENFITTLRKYKPTVIYGVPLNVITVNNNPNIKAEDLASIRTFMSGAAPLGGSDVEQFRAKTNGKINIIQGYGMTETSPVTHVQTGNIKNGIKTGGSGFLLPNTDAKIIPIDGTNTTLGPNQSGELLMRGPQVMQGYFNNPKASAEVLLEGGWIKTGDIAHYDEDEHFYITDRLKELIKVKGFQVPPAELEEVLRTHPDVADAAVIGIPHPIQGEAPKAFIVLKSHAAVKPAQLEQFVASKVSKHKHLVGGVVLVDAIPKSASGKILRRQLKNM